MSDIPTDAYREILRRVPVDSLCQFRVVCKAWRDIIDDPQFIKLHMQHVTGNDWIVLFHKFKGTSNVFLFPLKHLISLKPSLSAEWVYPTNTKVPPITPGAVRITERLFYPTCNGLLLITSHRKDFNWMIWNPFTGQSLKLPLCDEFPLRKYWNSSDLCGLGYVEASDDYKVVRIYRTWSFVFSVNLGAWRRIQDMPNEFVTSDHHGVFVNGALHWNVVPAAARDYYSQCIIALDLSKETYRKIQFPRNSDEKDSLYPGSWRLAALGGCLFCYAAAKTEKFVLWMIDDYNGSDDKTWIKMMSLKLESTTRLYFEDITPVAYLKAENRILLNISYHLAWYDLGKQCLSYLSIKVNPDEHGHQEADHYAQFPDFRFKYSKFQVIPASLIHLKSDQTSSKRKRKRAAKKFGLEVSINAPARVPT